MYIVEIHNQVVDIGTTIGIEATEGQTNINNFEFKVISIDFAKESFGVVWVGGDNDGVEDILPFAIFGLDAVKIMEVDKDNPNSVFVRRKHVNV